MVKLAGAFVCLVIVAIDIAAGILGIQANVAQNQVKHLRLWIFECKEPSHAAFKLGLAAAILLVVAHIITNLLHGCMCIRSQDEFEKASSHRKLSTACLCLTWIVMVVGLSLLAVGIMSNRKSRASCGYSHRHSLSMGGILCFVHALFCVAYYVTGTAALRQEGN